MKFTLGVFSLLFCSLMFSNCTENVPNKHEQLYLDTADSLKLYKNIPAEQSQLGNKKMVEDYLTLSFTDFKEKYKADDKEVDMFSNSLQTAIEISKAFKAIEDNAVEIKALERPSIDSKEEGKYSFDHANKDAYKAISDTSIEIQVMMAK